MIWIVALILIFTGIYFIISGLRESFIRNYEEFEELKSRKEKEEKDVKVETKAGGVVLIGPIPIVFGESRFAVLALILSIILMLLSIFMLFSFR
jgi:uncharacterized protein (TIGR00304 family)